MNRLPRGYEIRRHQMSYIAKGVTMVNCKVGKQIP
jgi:hypothetical protein